MEDIAAERSSPFVPCALVAPAVTQPPREAITDAARIGGVAPKIWRGDGFSKNALGEARLLAVGRWLYLQARHGMGVLGVKHFLKPVAFENDDHENR